ncbi:STAS domain-containing protein [Streptomyces sclerotialus]|uniref:STAS domain-containing protein n=1 Tax=Streptomyces sclerotialus TaxID=1957 RepID=UPI0004CA22EA
MSTDNEALNVEVEVEVRSSDTAVVTVGGELDLDSATLLHHHLVNQLHHGRRHLVLNLAALDFMDSMGLNVLLRATREARQVSGNLYVAAVTPAVNRLLELTGLSATSPVYATVDDALAAIGSGEAATQG